MLDIIISNPAEFERKKTVLKSGGANNLHVVADFDKTLTMGTWKGEKRFSLIELIRRYKYLPDAYVQDAYALADHFRPIEYDSSLPLAERKTMMNEWWSTHMKHMSAHGLNKEIIERIIREQELGPREGLRTFLNTLSARGIPLLILSASMTDLIEGFLRKEGMMHANVHVISNKLAFDSQGKVTGYSGAIVHSLNKNETVIRDTPYYAQIAARPNVLLLGDNRSDVQMVEGLAHDCVLKIGFLNDDVEKNLDAYKQVYDVLILNDGKMDFVNKLLGEFFT